MNISFQRDIDLIALTITDSPFPHELKLEVHEFGTGNSKGIVLQFAPPSGVRLSPLQTNYLKTILNRIGQRLPGYTSSAEADFTSVNCELQREFSPKKGRQSFELVTLVAFIAGILEPIFDTCQKQCYSVENPQFKDESQRSFRQNDNPYQSPEP